MEKLSVGQMYILKDHVSRQNLMFGCFISKASARAVKHLLRDNVVVSTDGNSEFLGTLLDYGFIKRDERI